VGARSSGKTRFLEHRCSAIAADSRLLAVGTSDGTVYLYGTAPTLGWASGTGFRSHAPLVLGQAVVALQLVQEDDGRLRMLVATADGSFGVYSLLPECKLLYKGSILPAMTHMSLSTSGQSKELPRLARIQITESGHLFLVLSLEPLKPARSSSEEGSGGRSSQAIASVGVGGALQAFVYHREMELWLRVSDSRFLLSDFYSTLPTKLSGAEVLGTMDNAVKSGAVMSSLRPSRRIGTQGTSAAMYYAADEEDGGNLATRSHCEDRLACALALKSSTEFQSWLVLYVRMLAIGGHADHLRFVVDLLLGASSPNSDQDACWWLSSAPTVLGLDRKELVKTVLIPEMSKNRALQRVTNEIAMEL
jgi:protein HIRA/HIR1